MTTESATEWSASNPPTRRELAETYLLTLAVWMPPLLYATGLHDEALDVIHFLVMQPVEIFAEATKVTFEGAGSGATSGGSTEPVSPDELSPGAFVTVAILQIAVALAMLAFGVMATVVGIILAVVYVVAFFDAPRRSYRATVAYYRAHTQE